MVLIVKSKNKNFWCRIGFHNWGKWRVISLFSSNVEDFERRCYKCGQIIRKTRAK